MKKILLFLLLGLLCLPAYAAQVGAGVSSSTLTATYLKLDCSNDPLTGTLNMGTQDLVFGSATTDSGALKMTMGAQTGDPTMSLTLETDGDILWTMDEVGKEFILHNTGSGSGGILRLKGADASAGTGIIRINDENDAQYLSLSASSGYGIIKMLGTSPGRVSLQSTVEVDANLGVHQSAPAVGLHIGSAASSQSLTSTNDVFVTGKLEVNGVAYLDGTFVASGNNYINDAANLYFGSSADSRMAWNSSQVPETLTFGLATASNSLILMETADWVSNFGHPLQTNPTLYIQSGSTEGDMNLNLSHDQTDARIRSESGNISFGNGNDSNTLTATEDVYVTGKLEVDNTAYFDGETIHGSSNRHNDNQAAVFGSAQNVALEWRTSDTPDTLRLGLGALSNAIVINKVSERTTNFLHPLQANPTIFLHAGTNETTTWLGLTHNTTNAVISTGVGNVRVEATLEVAERMILTPSAITSVSSAGGIAVTNAAMRVSGEAAGIDLTADPQIADGVDGQVVEIWFESDTNTIKLDDGTGLQLTGGTSFTGGLGDYISFTYLSDVDIWRERQRADN